MQKTEQQANAVNGRDRRNPPENFEHAISNRPHLFPLKQMRRHMCIAMFAVLASLLGGCVTGDNTGVNANADLELTDSQRTTLEKQAMANDSEAATRLSVYYGGIKLDYARELYWQRKAAEGGDPMMEFDLAVTLSVSHKKKERDEAGIWFKRASAGGIVNGFVDYKRMRPVAFLNYLKQMLPKENMFIAGYDNKNWISKNWISKKDLPLLLSLSDSKEPCAAVVSTYSRYYPKGNSTVGREAIYMIYGYKKGEYPPELNSYNPAKPAAEEREWDKVMIEWCRKEIGRK